jgi:hypothetical protein
MQEKGIEVTELPSVRGPLLFFLGARVVLAVWKLAIYL